MPIFDLTNHPSPLSLARAGEAGERFTQQAEHPRKGCIQFEPDWRARKLRVLAPAGLALRAGDEIYNYYGDAGAGASSDEERMQAEDIFVAQYGFSPWQ